MYDIFCRNTINKEGYNNYQEMMDEDERRMDGETPPPSASPIHQVEFNNNVSHLITTY